MSTDALVAMSVIAMLILGLLASVVIGLRTERRRAERRELLGERARAAERIESP